MEVDEEQSVKLKTSDGRCFKLTKTEASCSNALRTMMESTQNPSNIESVHLASVDSQMLTKVIEWSRVHLCNDDSGSQAADLSATCMNELQIERINDMPNKEFFDELSESELFRLMHVANYLDVRSLYDACCRMVAKRWESLEVEDIRKMYNIESDLSLEEERDIILESRKLGMGN